MLRQERFVEVMLPLVIAFKRIVIKSFYLSFKILLIHDILLVLKKKQESKTDRRKTFDSMMNLNALSIKASVLSPRSDSKAIKVFLLNLIHSDIRSNEICKRFPSSFSRVNISVIKCYRIP